MTNPATKTKSMGLRANARVVMVFASPSGQFYRDRTTRCHLSGLSHLDNFIVTSKSFPLYRDFAKTHANPDTPRYRSGQAAATH